MFREGEEEIASAFSPRPRMKPSGLRNPNGRGNAMSTVDFWKRFSVMRLDADGTGGKERYVGTYSPLELNADERSEWLKSAENGRKTLWRLAIGLVLLVSRNCPPLTSLYRKVNSELVLIPYRSSSESAPDWQPTS
jgi:hypothetical protein